MYDEIFGDNPKVMAGPPDPLKVDTELVVEMGLVAEYANGSMKEWEQRSWADRRAWVYYKMLQNAKMKKAEEAPAPTIFGPNGQPAMPQVETVRDRPGVRYQ